MKQKPTIKLTQTMLNKSICDCPATVRAFLKDNGIVDYDKLTPGKDGKVRIKARMKSKDTDLGFVEVSCYRAKGRGDKRIWFNKAKQIMAAGGVVTFTTRKKALYLNVEDDFRGWKVNGQVIFSLPKKEGK